MIVRIVKLTIHQEKIAECLAFALSMQPTVKALNGCQKLELLQDKNHHHIFFSYSHWDSEEHLNQYRHSAFFKKSWATLKCWFADKPEAWSTEVVAPSA